MRQENTIITWNKLNQDVDWEPGAPEHGHHYEQPHHFHKQDKYQKHQILKRTELKRQRVLTQTIDIASTLSATLARSSPPPCPEAALWRQPECWQ